MVIEAHIGLLDDPSFDFYSGDYNDNIPKRLSPLLPDAYDIHKQIWAMVRDGTNDAKQLDWGAVGAIFTKRELIDFLVAMYERPLQRAKERVKEVTIFVHDLDPAVKYVIVAYETGEESDE